MDSHIALRIARTGEQLVLPSDFALDIEEQNPYWNDGGMFTYPGSVPTEENADWLKVIQTLRSAVRIQQLEQDGDGKDVLVDILVDGVPYRQGRIRFDDEQEIDGSIGFSIESVVKSIGDLVADLNCRDVPVKDDVLVGEMLNSIHVEARYHRTYTIKAKSDIGVKRTYGPYEETQRDAGSSTDYHTIYGEYDETVQLSPLGMSVPHIYQQDSRNGIATKDSDGELTETQNCINVSAPYPAMPYCNSRISYAHVGKDGGEVIDTGKTGPYYVLPADRRQSGICFYVLYFIDCLFKHIGLTLDHTALQAVEDLKRLAFFTTKCAVERRVVSAYQWLTQTEAEAWLSSRDLSTRLMGRFHTGFEKVTESVEKTPMIYNDVFDDEERLNFREFRVGGQVQFGSHPFDIITSIKKDVVADVLSVEADVARLYATSKNFPDKDVKGVLDSLFAAFGVRFIVDYEKRQAQAVLMRDLYRDHSAPIVLDVLVTDIVPVTERIDGVRMAYSDEQGDAEKRANVTNGVKDYDTIFNYIDYAGVQELPYADILKKVYYSNHTPYIDPTTGNAYRIKVNKEAKVVEDLRPSLFEVGGYNGVEVGDCADGKEVTELTIGLEPLQMNDVNAKAELTGERQQLLVPFFDGDMKNEADEVVLRNVFTDGREDFFVEETMNSQETYDVTSTDNGESPLQAKEWGASVTVMRGGGADASLQDYDENYDGFGNAKWAMTAGDYAMNSDSIDAFGNVYDYNGNNDGIGGGERFSLKVRAYKTVDGEAMIDNADQKGRGLYDTFMAEHAYFLLHRKKYRVTVRCELVELQRITNNWNRRFQVGELVGWVNKVTSHVTVEGGMEGAVLEMYCL